MRGGRCKLLLDHADRAGCLYKIISRQFSEATEPLAVPLSIAAFQVWGANTDVGKTIVSAGLMTHAARTHQVSFLKPVQTGFPEDCDSRLVASCAGLQLSYGSHASELLHPHCKKKARMGSGIAHTEFAWSPPMSPHVAAANPETLEPFRGVGDTDIQNLVAARLRGFASSVQSGSKSLCLVETAGGPGSPGPSGKLQADIYRPLRLPAILVGDEKLGGISTTLAAYEMLSHRGYDIAAIVLMTPGYEDFNREAASHTNVAAIQQHFQHSLSGPPAIVPVPVCRFSSHSASPPAPVSWTSGESPDLSKSSEIITIDSDLKNWLASSETPLLRCLAHLTQYHEDRVDRLSNLPERTLQHVWYPFTQHKGLSAKSLTTVDSRSGDKLQVFKNDEREIVSRFDGCASWWTQGVSADLQHKLSSEIARGIARYGHVIHPQTVTEPAVELAELLLEHVGGSWASKVFYSDDGSTAIEVALKMAFRKYWRDHPDLDLHGSPEEPPVNLKVVGIDGGYHGDTLGAMDAVAPSPYNGPAQYPWYSGRGLFLTAPYMGIRNGKWQHLGGSSHASWQSLEEVLDPQRLSSASAASSKDLESTISQQIERYEAESKGAAKIGACIIEPVVQGAGGMLFVDPQYQRALIHVARQKKIPIIFDEVFTGLWRLGVASASSLLKEEPDIACFAKLLTGGVLPLSATLASQAVYEAFLGDSKLEGLLHGHSYSGHCAGTSAGVAALKIFSSPSQNPSLKENGSGLIELWPSDMVDQISRLQNVASVVCIGTVIAVELKVEGSGGYASAASAEVVAKLKKFGLFARPLGNIVYLMLTPTSTTQDGSKYLRSLMKALSADD